MSVLKFRMSILRNFTSLHQFSPPISDDVVHKQREFAGKILTYPAFNDCLLRNMHRHRFISVVDFDEVIVPTKLRTYHDLVEEISKTRHVNLDRYSLMFMSSNYFLEYAPDSNVTELLPLLRHREYVNTPGLRVKSFQNPRQCQRINSHHCETSFNAVIPYSLGRVHHYRETCYSSNNPQLWSDHKCAVLANRTMIDSETSRFHDALIDRVKVVPRDLRKPTKGV